jgi:hypothetical protein
MNLFQTKKKPSKMNMSEMQLVHTILDEIVVVRENLL